MKKLCNLERIGLVRAFFEMEEGSFWVLTLTVILIGHREIMVMALGAIIGQKVQQFTQQFKH